MMPDTLRMPVKKEPEKMIKIILEENENIPPTGLALGLNGRTWHLKPGEAVDVPLPIVEILDNAIMSKPVKSQDGRGISHWRDQMRFPYRVVRDN